MYRIETDSPALEQVDALPTDALIPYAEILALLEVAPWSGQAYHKDLPNGPIRALHFGRDAAGQVYYLILERQRRIIVLEVLLWIA